ncbi:ABC transporter permease [Actinotalea sp.]|uniref:ABC transporter permease n=1 Tax=Actinotalea sp. TaxID=1872145 RepID=UPI00356A4FEA
MTSTTAAEGAVRPVSHRLGRAALAVTFWLGVWQVAAVAVDQHVLLVTPAGAFGRLVELVVTVDFWGTVGHSLLRIGAGFLLAAAVGILGASLAHRVLLVDVLLTPALAAIRSTPVVSFIILVLIWSGSGTLAVVISFLMVLPILYTTTLEGIRHRDRALLEMTTTFRVPWVRRLPVVDLPAVLPFVVAGCKVGVGLAWKSGIAAEVIGLPQGSIGEQLYEAKIFLSSADLFAWTVVVVALAYGFERLVLLLLERTEARLARGPVR